ncbi:MAG: GGDEF domain-containing protein [Myxococcales bacterium]|nr:GGDEF domain-containing protein [Myxococcales bacterium]
MDSEIKTRVAPFSEPHITAGAGQDCLVVIYAPSSKQLGKRFSLVDGEVSIGRGIDNTVILNSDSISRRHAGIEIRAGGYYLIDRHSTNGTYVNDELVLDCQLRRGDQIKIGDTILKFLSGADLESQYHETIYRMTIMDGLTGIHNKRYLVEQLDRELSRATRHGRPLSVVICDIDHFKLVNDEFGHLAGDYVLKEVAQLAKSRIRPDDVIARYGGEEIAIILPETELAGGVRIADELRKMIDDETFVFEDEHIDVTISCGVAQLQPGWRAYEFVRAADTQLYEAKRAGRNCVCPS